MTVRVDSDAPEHRLRTANASALLIRPPKYRIEGSGKGARNESGRDLEGVPDTVKEFAYNTVLWGQNLNICGLDSYQ